LEEASVDLAKLLPIAWNVILVIDSFYRTDWLAGTTVDTLIWLDVEHSVTFVDAIDWAFLDTGLVLHINARLGDYVCHVNPFK
jgi:hypothetical protein